MTVTQRRDHVSGANLCFNCLRTGHVAKECQSSFKCRICKKVHNTLLHLDTGATPTTPVNNVVLTSQIQGALGAAPRPQQKERLLMTSQVYLTKSDGERITARAMLDSGAAISVLSSRIMAQLQLPKTKDYVTVAGIESQKDSPARPTAYLTVSSTINNGWSAAVKVVILPKVTVDLPRHDLTEVKQMPHLQGLTLADPVFHQPRRVDLILDSDIFDEVLLPRKVEGPPSTPSAWETKLGWGIMGRYLVPPTLPVGRIAVCTNAVSAAEGDSLNELLQRFWKMEEIPLGVPALSSQELEVQKHYAATHYFSSTAGRYVVSLPRRTTTQQLGESRTTAQLRFVRNEHSLLKKGTHEQFQKVVREYLTLGHAQKTSQAQLCAPVEKSYYLPMHAVYKSSSSTTKLRVVFDGSCPTSSGLSLNDILATGPTLHPNLDQTLIRFRKYRIALSADISKMYREVILAEEDKQLHRFIWRDQPDQPLETYHMNRVTFGIRCSPYLAVRSLQQTAEDFSSPETKEYYHIYNSFYVDDLLAGADDMETAVSLYQGLRTLLLKAGFDLRKWRSSSTEVLESIPTELQEVIPQQNMTDRHALRP